MSGSLADEIQAAVDFGYAQAADILGQPYEIFRPMGTGNPLDSANLIGTLPATFDATPYKFNKPNLYGTPVWYPLLDVSLVQPFDYLVGPLGTFFMHPQQPLLPLSCVSCNATVTVTRAKAARTASGFGAQAPGGDDRASETVLATAWPCSLLEGTKGEKAETGLPGDTRAAWFKLLVPALPGVTLRSSDILTDGQERRMVVSSAEITDLGWRISVALEVS